MPCSMSLMSSRMKSSRTEFAILDRLRRSNPSLFPQNRRIHLDSRIAVVRAFYGDQDRWSHEYLSRYSRYFCVSVAQRGRGRGLFVGLPTRLMNATEEPRAQGRLKATR